MSMIDFLGWSAAALVLTTFYLKTITPLRLVAIASNVLFILFGLLSHTLPIMILHCLLLPLNIWRLVEMRQLRERVRRCPISDLSLTLLLPFMRRGRAERGRLLFSRGEKADQVYLLLSGAVLLRYQGSSIKPGQLVGLMEIFSPTSQRVDTAECQTDVEFAAVPTARFWEIAAQHPRFGNYLVRTIVRQQLGDGEERGAQRRQNA